MAYRIGSAPLYDTSFAFSSPSGGGMTFYAGGYYVHHTTDGDFSGATTFGTANHPYAAHFYVVLGAATVDEITITVTGTTITDAGVRDAATGAGTIVIPHPSSAGDYFETSEKFLGQVSGLVTAGTAKTCNYGYAKYHDARNTSFDLNAFEILWYADKADASFECDVLKHSAVGWTFNAAAPATPPAALYSMTTIHGAESDPANDEPCAFKRTALSDTVNGGDSQGLLVRIVTGGISTTINGTATFTLKPDV